MSFGGPPDIYPLARPQEKPGGSLVDPGKSNPHLSEIILMRIIHNTMLSASHLLSVKMPLARIPSFARGQQLALKPEFRPAYTFVSDKRSIASVVPLMITPHRMAC